MIFLFPYKYHYKNNTTNVEKAGNLYSENVHKTTKKMKTKKRLPRFTFETASYPNQPLV